MNAGQSMFMRQFQRADWMVDAECHGLTDLFYPVQGEPAAEAKAVCAACPVQRECRDYALDNNERFGIWSGLSLRERAALRRGRNAA